MLALEARYSREQSANETPRSSSAPCLIFRDSRWKRRINFRIHLAVFPREASSLVSSRTMRSAYLSVVSVYRLARTGSSRRGGVLRAKLFTKRTDSARITIVNCRVKVADQQIAGRHLASPVSINQQLSRHNVSTFEAASNSCPRCPTFR